MENENQQEILQKLGFYEHQLNQLRQQFQAIEEGVIELSSLSMGLEEVDVSEGEEILAPIGRGVFVKAKITSKELIVDVGNRTLVKKDIPETKKIIEEQISKLESLKKDLENNMESIQEEATDFLKGREDVSNESE
ncbi:MAG: prefoldin subunit alpha [Nanoarchaeota archaeon]|nr:prefoldin subunit alpha [Nanoarchaeota archaeon]